MSDEVREVRVALCPDCGQSFEVHVDRILSGMDNVRHQEKNHECPHCGCQECRLKDTVH